MSIKGKTVIVTGASKGIGRAIALRFAAEGAMIILVDIMPSDETAGAIKALRGSSLTVTADITDHSSIDREFDRIARDFGSIDVLVNNAGIIARGTLDSLDHDTWKKVVEVNINGTFNCCKAVVPHMLRIGYGRIVNITSIAGKMGDISAAPVYGTTKGAINTLTKSMARQLAPGGIRVNAVAPHAVETDMSAEWSEEKRRAMIAGIPLGRLAQPEEVAEAALFLASDRSSFITGEILNVNGGALMD